MALMKVRKTPEHYLEGETGEMVNEKYTKKRLYASIYLQAMANLLTGVKVRADILFELLLLMDFPKSTITIVKYNKEMIGKKVGVTVNHVDVVLNHLTKCTLFTRISRGVYMVNPDSLSGTNWKNLIGLRMLFESISREDGSSGEKIKSSNEFKWEDAKNE